MSDSAEIAIRETLYDFLLYTARQTYILKAHLLLRLTIYPYFVAAAGAYSSCIASYIALTKRTCSSCPL